MIGNILICLFSQSRCAGEIPHPRLRRTLSHPMGEGMAANEDTLK